MSQCCETIKKYCGTKLWVKKGLKHIPSDNLRLIITIDLSDMEQHKKEGNQPEALSSTKDGRFKNQHYP